MLNKMSERGTIISSVTSPLGLLTLMVLVAEAALFLLTPRAEGTDFTIIVVGMVAIIPMVLLVVYFRPGIVQQSPILQKQQKIYDAFISAPMAAWESDEEYKAHRNEVLKLRDTLRKECKFKRVFYAGLDIGSVDDFEVANISARDDFQALANSKYFILLYPKPLPTSALVEVGAAIAFGMPSVYFVPDRKMLPFILREAESGFENVRIREVSGNEQILGHIRNHGIELFS
jgi:hypothetical protein